MCRTGAPQQQQVSQSQVGGNVLLPPSYHPSGPSSGHTLPTLADLTQGNQPIHHQPSQYNTHPPPPNTGHSLPGLGHTLQQSPQRIVNQDRERELREQRREMEMIERQRQREEMHMREQEQLNREQLNRDRELADRAHHRDHMQHHPVQNHAGSIPIHQPVASKVPNSIHGPNGLLSTLGSGSAPAKSIPASNGPSALFTMGSQQQESTPRPAYLHQSGPPSQLQQMPGFAGPAPSPMPAHAVIGQQQPILNVSMLEIALTLQCIDIYDHRMHLVIWTK